MMHAQFLRIKKLKGKSIIHVAAKHNHREILSEIGVTQDSHINPSRVKFNYVLRGLDTAHGVAGMAQSLLDNADIKTLRKDAVRALEIIFSLPPDSHIDHSRYFEDSTQWAEGYFQAPVISAIVHLDEAAPHCHVLLLPLVKGRMIGSDLMGSRSKLKAMQVDFNKLVGKRYGLTYQAQPRRLSTTLRRDAALSVLNAIKGNHALLNKPSVLQALIDAIKANPEPALMALGLDMPKSKAKKQTFVEVMTKPVKQEKPIGFENKKPIGFEIVESVGNIKPYVSVGFAISKQSIQAKETQQTDPADSYQRISDKVAQAGYWDEMTGEYITHPVKQSKKLTAIISAHNH